MSEPIKNISPAQNDSVEDAPRQARLPFRLARFLSWVSLVLILAAELTLAVFIGNSARDTLLERQQEYSLLLGSNLSHQIIRRFVIPTARVTGGRINLTDPIQYARLDEVVHETVRGLDVEELRIYGNDKVVNYSLDSLDLGREDLMMPFIERTLQDGVPVFERAEHMPWFQAIFHADIPPRTFILRMSFPLAINATLPSGETKSQVFGAVEVIKDITEDYATTIRFQWFILLMCLGSSVVLFGLLRMSIQRAELILAERIARNRRLEAKVHENDRLAGMGRVIASIAHEIRNPLGIIRSSAELLLRRIKDSDAVNKKILTAIHDESCRLSQIVNDFLDYARPRPANKSLVDLNLVIDQAAGFLEGELEKSGVELIRNLPRPFMVTADKDLLYRALYNIFINSLQAMENGGQLLVSGRTLPDGSLEINIIDSGPGFPEGVLDHILEPFFTTKDHGTGLGMAIVNTIITGHEGRLELSNVPEGGARTCIILPPQQKNESENL